MTPRRGYTDGPYGQIHFADTGAGVPLLLFHQAPMSLRQFDSVFGRLADCGIRAIGVDMPGYGYSDPTDFVPAIEDYARIAPALLDHLSITDCYLLGHHTGSQVATEAAFLLQNRVRGLILNGPTPFSPELRQRGMDHVEKFEKNLKPERDGSHLSEAFKMRMSYANDLTKWPLTTRYLAEQFIGLGPFWYGHHAAFSYDHAASIAKIDRPCLILTNTGDEIYNLALETRKLRPDLLFVELEGGGIDIVDEQPDEWVNAVADFVHSEEEPG